MSLTRPAATAATSGRSPRMRIRRRTLRPTRRSWPSGASGPARRSAAAVRRAGRRGGGRLERTSTGKSYAVGKSDAKRGVGLATAFSGYDDGSSARIVRHHRLVAVMQVLGEHGGVIR